MRARLRSGEAVQDTRTLPVTVGTAPAPTPTPQAEPTVAPVPDTPAPESSLPTAAVPALRAVSARLHGRTLRLRVALDRRSRVAVRLRRAQRTSATAKARTVPAGTRTLRLRLNRRPAPGRHTVRITASAGARSVTRTLRVRSGAPRARAAAVTLRSGHADFGARIVGGKLQSQVKDATRRSGKVTWRDPSDVVVALGSRARYTLPKRSNVRFLGKAGTKLWLIPQTQRSGVIWLGWNTEALSSRQVRGGVAWTLERVSGPGRVVVYQTGSFGAADVLFDSSRSRPGTRNVARGVHAHGNWAFTRAGTYRLRFRMSATSRSGRALSDVSTLTVRVG
jgi:putative ABC transporter-associated repeat protein